MLVNRQQQRVGALGHQFAVCHGAGGHHAGDFAVYRALVRRSSGGHIAHLFGHSHSLTQLDEPREITLHRVHRHTGHHHRLTRTLAALCERDVQQPVGLARVVEKQLVKIAHAIENECVWEVCLDAQVLLHHGRVGRKVSRSAGGWRCRFGH